MLFDVLEAVTKLFDATICLNFIFFCFLVVSVSRQFVSVNYGKNQRTDTEYSKYRLKPHLMVVIVIADLEIAAMF